MSETRAQPGRDLRPERDVETVRLLVAGDGEGLRRLLGDHGARVRGTLRMDFKQVLDDADLDDALSQATLRVWQARERIDLTRGTLRAWFYAIARNRALRILEVKRRPHAPQIVGDLDRVVSAEREAAGSAAATPLSSAVHHCIEALAPLPRAVILADLAAGGTAVTQHLVQELRTTPNSIYVARATARAALRAALHKLGHPAAAPVERRQPNREAKP